jgi:hypothetical protein
MVKDSIVSFLAIFLDIATVVFLIVKDLRWVPQRWFREQFRIEILLSANFAAKVEALQLIFICEFFEVF